MIVKIKILPPPSVSTCRKLKKMRDLMEEIQVSSEYFDFFFFFSVPAYVVISIILHMYMYIVSSIYNAIL